MEERDNRWSRAAQVGMLMRAYRESCPTGEGKQGLTQAALLERMSAVNQRYAERYSHVTVSRWESGSTLPTVERLLDFGKALDLAPVEVEGLMRLAGFHWSEGSDGVRRLSGWTDSDAGADGRGGVTEGNQAASSTALRSNSSRPDHVGTVVPLVPDLGSIIRYLSFKCVLTGACVAVFGYALAAYGWDDFWMPLAYVGATMSLVLVQAVLHRGRPHDLGESYGASIFFLLSSFLLQAAATRMDPYGFYALEGYAGTHIPFLLALEVNLVLASIAGLAFHLLRQWQYSGDRAKGSPLLRGAFVAIPPAALVYASVLAVSNLSMWVQSVLVIPVIAAVYMTLLAIRDPMATLDKRDQRLLLVAGMSLGGALGTLGLAVVLALYLHPDVPFVLPDHNLFTTWRIDYSDLGYPEQDALDKLNQGYLWHGLATFAYMIFVVGGNLINDIRRMGQDDIAQSVPSAKLVRLLETWQRRRGGLSRYGDRAHQQI